MQYTWFGCEGGMKWRKEVAAEVATEKESNDSNEDPERQSAETEDSKVGGEQLIDSKDEEKVSREESIMS